MANIHIKRKHNLSRDKAKAIIEKLAEDLKGKLGAAYHWEGDSLRFQRSGASGFIQVKEDEVEVNVQLGMLLTPMRGVIESSINQGFDSALNEAGDSRMV